MPLSAAERQRRYKEKMKRDPGKYEEYKLKKRENYHKKKRLVKDLTPQEKYNARTIWRLRKKNLKQNKEKLDRLLNMTPPSSPFVLPEENEPQEVLHNSPQQKDDDTPRIGTPQSTSADKNSTKKNTGRKKIRRDRSKLYRENLKLQKEIENLKKKYEKFKKRYHRIQGPKQNIQSDDDDETTKYKKLSSAIKKKYQNTTKHKEKNMLKKIFENVDDTEREEMIKDSLGLIRPIRLTINVKPGATALEKKIESFFQREDISRPTAGKKETITRNGQKMQKRFLLDTTKNLYKAFKLENPNTKCSYYYFSKKKPFYVVKPSVSGREMCLCKTHTNPSYKAKALKSKGIIDSENMSDLIAAIACNPKEQDCMYGTCTKCCDLKIMCDPEKKKDKIQWKEWGRVQETYEKDGKILKATKNVKQDKEGTIEELIVALNAELKILKKHVYNIKVQFANFRQAIDNLQRTEAVVVADFSENYSCKHHEEIQAHHFGGSRLQVSMHTVVVYILSDNDKKIESYCTVSSNTNHQPAAIWAHLDPVLKDMRSSFLDVSTIHFFTDGPFSQYRQKQNFYLGSTAIFDYGFTSMTWSFFEAGHGKGPADGIGGYLKRSADDLVARGEDISCADKFYEAMKDVSKIKLYLIADQEITDIAKQMPPKIQPLPGTKNVHQLFTTGRGELKFRHLSCFCSRGFCECLSPKVYIPLPLETATNTTEQDSDQPDPSTENPVNLEQVPELAAHSENSFDRNALFSSSHRVDSMNSDEEPLSNYRVTQQQSPLNPLQEIGLADLGKPRNKNSYQMIYKTPDSSDSEQGQSSSGQKSNDNENRELQHGQFMLVNVHATKRKIFKYVCVVDDLHDDGEVRVTFLRSVKKKNIFRLDKSDVADIDYTDIVEMLAKPTITTRRGQQYYVFKNEIDICEM